MPRGDGTGPMGMGPMSGRGAGFCAGYGVPGYVNRGPGIGMGMGMGRGGGRGRRHWYYATGLTGWQRAAMFQPGPWGGYGVPAGVPTASPAQQLDGLKNQAEMLEEELQAIRKQIEELSVQESGEK